MRVGYPCLSLARAWLAGRGETGGGEAWRFMLVLWTAAPDGKTGEGLVLWKEERGWDVENEAQRGFWMCLSYYTIQNTGRSIA